MTLRQFAERVLLSESLDEKLQKFENPAVDAEPGSAVRVAEPARSVDLKFCGRRKTPPMPKAGAFADPAKRAVAHHIMANHELQALEIMAFVLLAFPDAPSEFRQGLVPIMEDEQRHTRMHVERAAALGLRFGELPVNGYFWNKAQQFQSVLDYLAGLPLTFEGRNLDHTLEFEQAFREAGDERSSALMAVVHRDEIRHVAFGLEWLRRLKPSHMTDWDAYAEHLHWPLRPAKSKGETFDVASRKAAGMSDEFIERLEQASSDENV